MRAQKTSGRRRIDAITGRVTYTELGVPSCEMVKWNPASFSKNAEISLNFTRASKVNFAPYVWASAFARSKYWNCPEGWRCNHDVASISLAELISASLAPCGLLWPNRWRRSRYRVQ